jgi:hypothetical protein
LAKKVSCPSFASSIFPNEETLISALPSKALNQNEKNIFRLSDSIKIKITIKK